MVLGNVGSWHSGRLRGEEVCEGDGTLVLGRWVPGPTVTC